MCLAAITTSPIVRGRSIDHARPDGFRIVMAVLVTAIHVLNGPRECMDGRHKAGHDEGGRDLERGCAPCRRELGLDERRAPKRSGR